MRFKITKFLGFIFWLVTFAVPAQNRVGSYYISGNVLFPKKFVSDYQLYLLNQAGDTIKSTIMTHGGNKAYFIIDSVRLSNNYRLFIKRITKSKDDELFLLNGSGNKKLAKFLPVDNGYICKIDAELKKEVYSKHTAQVETDLIDIEAKLLYGLNKNKPLKKHKVYLTNNAGDTIRNTITNNFGDFEFKQVKGKQDLQIKVENTAEIKNEKEIYVAQQSGVIITTIKRSGNDFTYRMLEADVVKLKPMNTEDDDTDFKIDAFTKSANKTIIVAQNIYYPINEYKITPDAADQLDIIADQLTKNPTLKLEIYSHTDSQGDDALNLDLSNKRANAVLDYLVSKGINKTRLSAKGMGEKQLLNRCANDVICSEKEHELNRRTEFKFIK
jgi:outer membrane protein OmpA-like peptidoglycan-associated protein